MAGRNHARRLRAASILSPRSAKGWSRALEVVVAAETRVGPFRIQVDPQEFYLWQKVRVDVHGTAITHGRRVVVDAEPDARYDRVKLDVLDPDERSLFSTLVRSDREVAELVALGQSSGDVVQIGAGLLELLAAAQREGFNPSTVKFSREQTDQMFRVMGEVAASQGRGDAPHWTSYFRSLVANSNWGRDEAEMPLFAVLDNFSAGLRRGLDGSDAHRFPTTESYLNEAIILGRGLLSVLPTDNEQVASFRTAITELVDFAVGVLRDGRIESKREAEERYGERLPSIRDQLKVWRRQTQTTTDKREIEWQRLP